MSSNTREPKVVRVSRKGQATIPKALREKFDIETPGEVFIYEEGDRIVIEPVPTLEELHGIHAGDHEPGEVIDKVREMDAEDLEREEGDVSELIGQYGTEKEE